MQDLACKTGALSLELHPNLFCFSYFWDRVLCFIPQASLDSDPPIWASHVGGDDRHAPSCQVFFIG
jgi:hypothetical protein